MSAIRKQVLAKLDAAALKLMKAVVAKKVTNQNNVEVTIRSVRDDKEISVCFTPAGGKFGEDGIEHIGLEEFAIGFDYDLIKSVEQRVAKIEKLTKRVLEY